MSSRFKINGIETVNGNSGYFPAKYDGVCGQCGFSIEKGETAHYVNGKIAHETCHSFDERDRFPDDSGGTSEREQGYTIRGKRKPKLCKECWTEHNGECP